MYKTYCLTIVAHFWTNFLVISAIFIHNKLTFLYLINGNHEKLKKMMKICSVRNDISGNFQAALYLGDVEERVNILKNCGQKSLAYLTAASHGLNEQAEELSEQAPADSLPEPLADASLLIPPPPINRCSENWPLLSVSKNFFDNAIPKQKAGAAAATAFDDEEALGNDDEGGWGDDDDLDLDEDGNVKEKSVADEDDDEQGDGWGSDDSDLDIPDDIDIGPEAVGDGSFVPPTKGTSQAMHWTNNSQLAGDHVAAGSFETACRLLHDQLAVVDFTEYKSVFISIYTASRTSIPGIPSLPSITGFPHRNWREAGSKGGLPNAPVKLENLVQQLQEAYKVILNRVDPSPYLFLGNIEG